MSVWERINESLGRVTEKRRLSDDQRTDWTAAVLMLRHQYYGLAKRDETKSGLAVRRDAPKRKPPAWLSKTNMRPGPVWLAFEAKERGYITQSQLDRWTYDTVLWQGYDKTGKATFVKLADDFGKWKDSVREELERFGLNKPRTDEQLRWWAVGLAVAGVITAVSIVVLTGGLAAPVVIAGATFTGAQLGGAALAVASAGAFTMLDVSDVSEEEFAAKVDEFTQMEVAVTGSSKYRGFVGGTIGVGEQYLAGETDPMAYADAFVDEYRAATAPPPAPMAPAESAGDKLSAWAGTTAGKVTIGAAAVLLLVLIARR